MVIYLQSRESIFDTNGRNIMVQENKIIAEGKTHVTLGEYREAGRAKEILGEIFRYIRNKKGSYVMPNE